MSEERAVQSVRLDLPGIDEQQLWSEIKSADGLIDSVMPANDQAAEYYRHAVERAIRKRNRSDEIVVKTEADLNTHRICAVFRPAKAPKVAAIRFSGNQVFEGALLESVVSKMLIGEEYSEYAIRQLLELNIRPLYEEKAHLTVAFPQVGFAAPADPGGAVGVSVGIEEGPAWSLGKVELRGEGISAEELMKIAQFPLGKPANWKQAVTSIDNVKRVFLHEGYLGVRATPFRPFREDGNVVDLEVNVERGKQFLFGSLQILGLDHADQQRASRMWKLKVGDPLDGPYIDDYFREVFKMLKGAAKSVSRDLRPQPGSNAIDVTLTFK